MVSYFLHVEPFWLFVLTFVGKELSWNKMNKENESLRTENQDGLLNLFLIGYIDSPAHLLNRPCSREFCILKLYVEA